jgi:hypothetical protein
MARMPAQIALLYEAVTGSVPDYSTTPAAIEAAAASMAYPDAAPAPAPRQARMHLSAACPVSCLPLCSALSSAAAICIPRPAHLLLQHK